MAIEWKRPSPIEWVSGPVEWADRAMPLGSLDSPIQQESRQLSTTEKVAIAGLAVSVVALLLQALFIAKVIRT